MPTVGNIQKLQIGPRAMATDQDAFNKLHEIADCSYIEQPSSFLVNLVDWPPSLHSLPLKQVISLHLSHSV